jgi:TolB-like protein
MPSIVPNFEYDIFISYRHNDNRSGWVTDFVNALQEELASTIKEPLSIYFDKNQHDGLLETHNVDKSLEGKLKCLIFIPILSQTYCDLKSFAWQHEFCAFNKLSQHDLFGRDIKLKSGNVASRILPVQIHELDAEDKTLIEKETGGALRAVEFIYQASGVVRPLLPNETDPKGNLKHTYYRDQVHKVVRGIKEIISAMRTPPSPQGTADPEQYTKSIPKSTQKKLSVTAALIIALGVAGYAIFYFTGWRDKLFREPDRSIAVLPFENMNRDSTQDYFSNGMSEDILNHLVKIADLRVKSRTSTLQYKGTTKTAAQIGEELNVANIVEGSVRRVGDQVRIVVQLIDAQNDVHLWSETYDRDFKDVLSLQSEIAMEIAKALQTQLSDSEKESISKQSSQNITAYDYFLKAREALNGYELTRLDYENALSLINQSLKIEPDFSKGLALKGRIWFGHMFDLGYSDKIVLDSVKYYANRSIEADPKAPEGHLLLSDVYGFLGKLTEARKAVEVAYKLAPNNPGASWRYGNQLLDDHDERGADLILKSIETDLRPQDAAYYNSYATFYRYSNDFETAEKLIRQAQKLDPGNFWLATNLANLYWGRRNMTKPSKQ